VLCGGRYPSSFVVDRRLLMLELVSSGIRGPGEPSSLDVILPQITVMVIQHSGFGRGSSCPKAWRKLGNDTRWLPSDAPSSLDALTSQKCPPHWADLEPVIALPPFLSVSSRAFRGFSAPLPASSAKWAALPARLRRPRLAVDDSEAWRGVDWADDLLPRGLVDAWERG
jgi:hypothetical protein